MYNKQSLYDRYPVLCECREDIDKTIAFLIETYTKNGKLLLCGNGGSCADCDHIVGELMKNFMLERKPDEAFVKKLVCEFDSKDEHLSGYFQPGLAAISLPSQTALVTAYLNDVQPQYVYAQLTYAYAAENDMLLCLSTSGNSKNVVNAAKTARAMEIRTAAITGKNESGLSQLCDVCIKIPESETYKVQELTLPVYHHICASLEEYFFGGNA